MQESTSLLILWLLSSLKQERSTLCLIQMLECPAAQAEIALHRVTADGLAEQRDETWNLTQAGADHLREALPALLFRDTGSPLEELISACESKMPETACEICTKRMRVLRRRADTAGSAGYLELLLNQLAQWQNRRLTAPEARSFVHYAFAAHDASLYYMKNAARSSAFMKKAAEYAASAGDKRTLVLIRFAQASATFFTGTIHFERAHETFHSAMELLKTLDDKELYTRITPFLILMHFIRGNFQQALECYEMLQKSTHKPVLPLFESQLVLQAASSAAYSGHFAHALGMIKSAISTAELEGNIMSAQIFRQHLGVLYAYMRREDDALETLQTVVSRSTMAANPKLMLRAFAAIALCYSRMGRAEMSYNLLSDTLRQAERHPSFSLSYNYLWILELAVFYAEHGFPPLPGIDLDTLFREAEISPSPMMRGHALRLKAILLRKKSPQDALDLLDKSLEILKDANMPIEYGFTERRRSELLNTLGRGAEAEAAEETSLMLLSRIGLGRKRSPWPSPEQKEASFDVCCREVGSIHEWETLEEYCYQLAACLRKVFRAERTALFSMDGETLLCRGSCNLSGSEIASGMFVPSRDLIRERIREEAPFSVQQNGLDRLCLPFRLPDGNPWLLYADSSAHSSRMLHCAQEDLSRVGLLCASELKNVLRLLEARNMRAEVRQIHAVTKMAQEERLELWGKSLSFRMCLERAKVVSATDAAVLLLGETGVGKEVMANYVHRHSGCKGPFVAVHPASVSEHLFENEFFGHEKGAFTGATGQKIGFFELADNGTLFIDEVGDIPMNMQIKLLRVLQEHRFMRVGGTKEIHSSFRLIAATNRDLPRAVREGTFREDLYYRISVIPVTIPPLRERLEDLEELIMAFTDHFSRRYGKKLPYPDEETLRRLSEYQWPGNIRELRNAVERAVILYTGGPFDLAVGGQHEARDHCQRAETSLYADTPTLLELQKRYIQYILNKTGGRISGENGAEKLLGMKRSTLYLKLRQYGIKPGERERERERVSVAPLCPFKAHLPGDDALAHPAPALPAAPEEGGADAFIHREGDPHPDEPEAERNAEHVTADGRHAPHEDKPDDERVHGVAGSAEEVHAQDVDGAPKFEDDVDAEDQGGQGYDFGVVAEQPHDALSEERGKQGHRKGNHQRDADTVPPEEQCGVLVPLADEVPYADAAALPHGHGEYVGKGHDVHGVGTCGESLIAEHVDEIGDHHLRKAVGKLFAPGRQADGQHLAEHPEREGPEKGGGKRQFFAEQDEEQQAHGYAAAERRGDGRAFDPKGGEAEMPENERIIPDDVDDVDEKGHLHGIIGHASAPQDGRKGQRDGLKEREPAHDAHIRHAVAHEFRPQFHKAQDAFGPEKEGGADDDAHHHIEGQRYADGAEYVVHLARPEELRTEHGRPGCRGLKDEEDHVQKLHDHAHGGHGVVRALAEHDRIHNAEQDDQHHLDEDGARKPHQPAADVLLLLRQRLSPLQQTVVLERHDEQRDAHRR